MNLRVKYINKENNFVSLPESKKDLMKKIELNNLNTSCLKLSISNKEFPIYVGNLKSLESLFSSRKYRNQNF